MIVLYMFIFSACVTVNSQRNLFELNIIHYNDFHARFLETSPSGRVCDPEEAPCIGGFARLTTLIKQALEPESILLNGGDSFQGTIWYNILRWNVTQDFMNMLPHTAHVLGNHEFDNGIDGLVPYLEALNSPVLTANIIDDDEQSIKGLYKPSIIVEKGGKKIGIIGVILAITNTLASTGKLQFTDEVEAVRREAEVLHQDGAEVIIVLSHSGLDIDREIALHGGPYIDIIVGGHSHTLLYNGEPPINSSFVPQGPYPVIVDQNGKHVLIVQVGAHAEYLGEIKLFFDDLGTLVRWEGNPRYVSNDIEQDHDVINKINYYLPLIEEQASRHVGDTMVTLERNCRCSECNFGNFICDAFLNAALDKTVRPNWHYAHFCVINQGNIRDSIERGPITFESILVSTPFENNVEVYDLRGDHILEMLEYAVANVPWPGARMVQVSGMRAVFNGSEPVNHRVVDVKIRCIECDIPRYEPLKLDKYYKMVSQSFIGEGGDGFTMISENRRNVEVLGMDYDILMKYVEKRSPVFMDVDGRIQIENPCAS